MKLGTKILAAALAVSMTSAPVVAQSAAAPVRSGAEMEDANELRGGWIIPLIALIAIILGLCAATTICGGDDDDLPNSP